MPKTKKTTKKVEEKTPGTAVATLILGIVAIITPVIGFITAIIAIILGIVTLKKSPKGKGLAVTGIILGVLSIIIHIIIGILIYNVTMTIVEDPAGFIGAIPGMTGCIIEGFECEYAVNDNTLTLNLTNIDYNNITVQSIETTIIKNIKEKDVTTCSWKGEDTIASKATKQYSIICNEPIDQEALIGIKINVQYKPYNYKTTIDGIIVQT